MHLMRSGRIAGLMSLFCVRHCALSVLINNSRKVHGVLSVEQSSIQK